MSEEEESVIRTYRCKVCCKNHEIELHKSILKGHDTFPFAHVFLHGELKDILTILFVDDMLQIRGAEVEKLNIDNLFSKEQSFSIVDNLTDEIEKLTNEIECLKAENHKLRERLEK